MYSLRSRLVLAFALATIVPLSATIWVTTSLLERSLDYASTAELDRLSRSFEGAVRLFYERERNALRRDAVAERVQGASFSTAALATWPARVRAFWESREDERFELAGDGGSRLDFLRRRDGGVDLFSRDLDGIRMRDLSADYTQARAIVGSAEGRDLQRGFTMALWLLLGVVWTASIVPLLVIAHRVSRPIEQLTTGLSEFAGGQWDRRIETARRDEVGRAVEAFNHMAEELTRSRDRLVHLTQMASWQSLARKTAHELKNSLTPIRLTVEEMLARQPAADRAFMEEAVQIVVSEIETLERRVRAFSEFSSEPPVSPDVFDVNALVHERVALLKPSRPDTVYSLDLDSPPPRAWAGVDLVKGILTNLLENAADAAGPGGTVLATTRNDRDGVVVEVHDSGPGIGEAAARTLFEPAITFKKHGMGLGLSIARKNALLTGGDIAVIDGLLGGAGFRVVLPSADGAGASST